MAFAAGMRFGVYEITGLIGVGGMGEVYRATDTKLGRDVAIKTLPSELAKDADRLARFEREAKLLATLNHAHIAAIYGLHEHEGTQFLAMELIEGETLERKLRGSPLPVEDALRLALEIAEALEAAHERGVVHRDLKPANIMVTREGRAKVLDFGLAKAFSSDPNQTVLGHSPALSLAMTQAGLILGTAGYMSPEQASGQPTDQRVDVWAFGVVLYEMLAGGPLFSGESVPHVLAGVLKTEPDWERLPKNLHPRLRLLLERCLTKKPRSRLQAIADARVEIEAMLGEPERGLTRESEVAVAAAPRARVLRLAAAVGVTAVIAGALGWFLRPVPPPDPGPVVRFSVPLPPEQRFTANPVSMIAVSPDGTRIAYAASGQLFLRNVDEREARPVQGTTGDGFGAITPTFSPDGGWLAYVNAIGPGGPWSVRRVPISGGSPVSLHNADGLQNYPEGLTWPMPDTMLFANAEGIVRLPANGGATEVLVPRAEDEWLYGPQLLPGGEAVLFTRTPAGRSAQAGFEDARIAVQSIGRSDRTVVWDGGSAARYVSSGHLVYAQGTALFAVAFDADTRAVRGGAVPMVEGLRRSSNGFSDTANVAISDTGTLVAIPGDPNVGSAARIETTLTWVYRDGREEPLPVRPDDYTMARISPDGTKVALVIGASLVRTTPPAIWIFDQRTENLSLLTADPTGDDGPVWSADGRRIFFRSFRGDSNGVYAIELDTGETTLIGASPDYPFALPWTISPDGRLLGLVNAITIDDLNIATLSIADGEFTRLLHEETNESEPSISPNGAWIAYAGAAGEAASELNIRPFPAVSRTRIPVGRGQSPVFSRDGSELLFVEGSGLSAAPITYEPTLRVGTPRRLFESAAYVYSLPGRVWDVDANGERFLMIREPGAAEADGEPRRDEIEVVLNWFEELKTRVPVD